jgi:hypothetical protein
MFCPPFSVYSKRSSFFVIVLEKDSINVYTYNWKIIESEKFCIPIFNHSFKSCKGCKLG